MLSRVFQKRVQRFIRYKNGLGHKLLIRKEKDPQHTVEGIGFVVITRYAYVIRCFVFLIDTPKTLILLMFRADLYQKIHL